MQQKNPNHTFAQTCTVNTAFDSVKPIAIGSDHAGFGYKSQIISFLEAKGFAIINVGAHSSAPVDYPDFAHPVAEAVKSGEAACGILICGSANGVAITANKHAEIRAAICWLPEIASLARRHNNANVLCLPARFVPVAEAEAMVGVFLSTSFEGGHHAQRVAKIACA